MRSILYRFREILHGRLRLLDQHTRGALYRLIYPIGHDVKIARGCRLWGRDIRIGNHTTLDWGVCIMGPVTLGSHIYINQHAFISQNVTVGDHVGIGAFSVIHGDSRRVSDDPDCRVGEPYEARTIIEPGAMIAGRVTILPGVRVGRGAVIGAGSVVTHDCEPNALYAGVPARKIRDLPVRNPQQDGDALPASR